MIPFYGASDPDMFAIERAAMDPAGLVISAIDGLLPQRGTVIDVGAGDGFAAARLASRSRTVIGVEPARGMIVQGNHTPCVMATAQTLPFADGSLDAAYATWAYFFPKFHDPAPGLAELHRAVTTGGPLIVADNLGGDEFTSLAPTDIATDVDFWAAHGFECHPVETAFEFNDLDEATTLLGHFFGEAGRRRAARRLTFRVGLFVGTSRGP